MVFHIPAAWDQQVVASFGEALHRSPGHAVPGTGVALKGLRDPVAARSAPLHHLLTGDIRFLGEVRPCRTGLVRAHASVGIKENNGAPALGIVGDDRPRPCPPLLDAVFVLGWRCLASDHRNPEGAILDGRNKEGRVGLVDDHRLLVRPTSLAINQQWVFQAQPDLTPIVLLAGGTTAHCNVTAHPCDRFLGRAGLLDANDLDAPFIKGSL